MHNSDSGFWKRCIKKSVLFFCWCRNVIRRNLLTHILYLFGVKYSGWNKYFVPGMFELRMGWLMNDQASKYCNFVISLLHLFIAIELWNNHNQLLDHITLHRATILWSGHAIPLLPFYSKSWHHNHNCTVICIFINRLRATVAECEQVRLGI